MKRFIIVTAIMVACALGVTYLVLYKGLDLWLLPHASIIDASFRVDGTDILALDEDGEEHVSTMHGVDIGGAEPGHFATEQSPDCETYERWFDLIASMGANTVHVYMLMAPSFYEALAAHNEDAAEPLYLLQGIYLDDHAAYSHMDGYDDGYMGTLRGLIGQRRRWHTGLYESMRKHEHIFANHRYGLVGSISYGYFLIYELWSPVIELAGILTVLIACAFNFINVPLTILFYLIYAIFGAVMSLTAFFSRVQTRDLKLTASDIVRAIMLSLIEVTVLRFILAVTRMLALVGYPKRGRGWERVERTHLDASRRLLPVTHCPFWTSPAEIATATGIVSKRGSRNEAIPHT